MNPSLTLRAGALALACFTPAVFAQDASEDVLGGMEGLACEAILCLSSSLQPGECAPSLDHYFGIKVFNKHGLDWGATVAARQAFLGMCPVVTEPGMSERISAIANGAGKCDAAYLNSAYSGTAYRYRERGYSYDYGSDSYAKAYEVHEIPTVTMSTLPGYCVSYNDHAWTYELSVKYVGTPEKGGRWVNAQDYGAAQAKWNADHGGSWASGWNFSLQDPRESSGSNSNN